MTQNNARIDSIVGEGLPMGNGVEHHLYLAMFNLRFPMRATDVAGSFEIIGS